MKTKLLSILLLLATAIGFTQTTYYVDSSLTTAETGKTWATAFKTLQPALDAAVAGDQVWVAAGTYVPTEAPDESSTGPTDRNNAFHFSTNIKVYGGFAGTESTITDRVSGNETILSGDLDNDNDTSDNAYHVMITKGLTNSTILDGFTIAYGNATDTSFSSISYQGEVFYNTQGGGMNFVSSSPNITNVIFLKNYGANGGAIYNSQSTFVKSTLSNVAFVSNTAQYGSVIFAGNYNALFSNITVLGDSATPITAIDVSGIQTVLEINNSVIWNNGVNVSNTYGSVSGSNNANKNGDATVPGVVMQLTSNPYIDSADPDGTDNIFGTSDDGLVPLLSSGLINTGGNTLNSEVLDIAGNTRIHNTTIDIGAYENQQNILTTTAINGTITTDIQESNGGYVVNTSVTLTATPGTGYQFDGWSGDLSGTTNPLSITMDANKSVTATFSQRPTTIFYVNQNATTGTSDGKSWTTAYTDLQQALNVAVVPGDQVWVAAGTYVPTEAPDDSSTTTTDRNNAFHFNTDIKVYGGFIGTESIITDRVSGNETILSGDLDVDEDTSDNTYHVLITADLTNNAIIDGFTISEGNADATSNITYESSTFDGNRGGGLYSIASSPTINNVIFSNNSAGLAGGGLHNFTNSSPVLTNVVFVNNTAGTGYGGGMYSYGSSPVTITNATFVGNTAGSGRGSAIWNQSDGTNHSNSVINNSVFFNNTNEAVVNYSTPTTQTGANNASNDGTVVGATVNLTSDPFANSEVPEGLDDMFGTTDDGLMPVVSLIDAGDNTYLPITTTKDLVREARIFNNTVDIGAYEAKTMAYKLTKTAVGGTITASIQSANGIYQDGTSLILTATPDRGYSFSGWVGVTSTTNSVTVVMDADKTVTATFSQIPVSIIYVDIDATTGAKNGTSWQDAYLNIHDALNDVKYKDEIWIAAGTYTPHATDQTVYYEVTASNIKIYGGFSGTEGNVNDRVFGQNETIISGDLGNNDDPIISFDQLINDIKLSDNADNLLYIENSAEKTYLDGLTFRNAVRNNSYNYEGGAIIKRGGVSLDINNCKFKNNLNGGGNSAIYAPFNDSGSATSHTLTIANSEFRNNMSTYATCIYAFIEATSTTNVNVNVNNCLFANNQSADKSDNSQQGITASAIWLRHMSTSATYPNPSFYTYIYNSTFANNIDNGSYRLPTSSPGRSVVTVNRLSSASTNLYVYNSIFSGNTTTGGYGTYAVNNAGANIPSLISLNNLLYDDYLTNIYSNRSLNNVSKADALFYDATNGDYRLSSLSPAIDTGNNSNVASTTTKDLLNNSRTVNGTVDIGAYEYDATTLSNNNAVLDSNKFTIYPSPVATTLNVSSSLNIQKVEIYTLLGAKVLTVYTTAINVIQLNSGMYLLKLYSIDGKTATTKFIKQ